MREMTRKNSDMFAERSENLILLSLYDLGTFAHIRDHTERIDFEITLNQFSQHVSFAATTKDFVVAPIYREVLEGGVHGIEILPQYM